MPSAHEAGEAAIRDKGTDNAQIRRLSSPCGEHVTRYAVTSPRKERSDGIAKPQASVRPVIRDLQKSTANP